MSKTLLALLGLTTSLYAAEQSESPCCLQYCVGPDLVQVNAPCRPLTCNGDITITAAAIYWNAHQEGMTFAIKNGVRVPVINPTPPDIEELNNLIDDDFIYPSSKWDLGFKLGIGYNFPCDGWDIGLLWTRFHPFSTTHAETHNTDNQTLVTLWSAFAPAQGEVNFAREITAHWKLILDLLNFSLGRRFWVSEKLSLHPLIGLRLAQIKQKFVLDQRGGSWSPRINPIQPPLNNEVRLGNAFKGFGPSFGIEMNWHLRCGFVLYGNTNASLIYGRFDISQREANRLIITPFWKTPILSTKDHFRATRALLDWALGLQWSALISDQYVFSALFCWEQNLFFNQNQLFRVVRIGDEAADPGSGQNVFSQQRGALNTQGWTLSLKWEF